MSTVEIDSLLNAEEGNISRLIYISRTPPIISLSQGRLICSNCGKDKNTVKNLSEKDLKRWGIENDGDLATNCFARSKCCCGHGNDGQRKNETHKFKKKLSTSNSNVARNDQSSSKDFISHNIKTCDAYRFRENWPTQKSSLFHHYKHLGDYMDQYRACKIEKLEHNTTYLLDQSLFSEEVYNSISNSLSKFMENVALDEQTSNRHKESLVQKSKSDHRVNEMKPKKQTSVNPYVFNDTGIQEMQRSQYLKSLELCMKCGDNLKQQDVFSSLSYAGKQDRDFISRSTNSEKSEDKKMKKLLKRSSDQRPRLVLDKPTVDLGRAESLQSYSPNLQPLCQQMPIQIEKRSTFKKDGWRGHPTSTKPKFSEGLANSTKDRKKDRTSGAGNSLEYADVFNGYGEKYTMLKEST